MARSRLKVFWHKLPAAAALAACCLVLAVRAGAQDSAPVQYETRLDAIMGSQWAVHAGLGVSMPLGTYVRYGAVAGIGAGADGLSGRTDLIARFTLDPFRERRWAPYAVLGVSGRFGGRPRQDVLLLAGAEGPTLGKVAPAIEVGFGGGIRAALVLRQSFLRRR